MDHWGTLPPSVEFRIMCKDIMSSDIDLVFGMWERMKNPLLGFGSRGGGDGTLA